MAHPNDYIEGVSADLKNEQDPRIVLIYEALQIMEKRATDERRSVATQQAYNSAICMICYALAENAECLHQFDE